MSEIIATEIGLRIFNRVYGGRIIGGAEVVLNSRPYQAALFINSVGFCGGSIIARDWILTAAHCTTGASFIQVIVGAHNITQVESTQQILTSRNFFVHPGYNTTSFPNDVALLSLPVSLALTSYVGPISLAPASSGTFAGSTGFLTGWGLTIDDFNTISPVLQGVALSVITNAECQITFGANIIESTVCTSGAGPVGGCSGDSGGPLVVGSTQIGIVSFASGSCVSERPTAYTKVSSYRSWIQSVSGV